jgi:hypothetical protein
VFWWREEVPCLQWELGLFLEAVLYLGSLLPWHSALLEVSAAFVGSALFCSFLQGGGLGGGVGWGVGGGIVFLLLWGCGVCSTVGRPWFLFSIRLEVLYWRCPVFSAVRWRGEARYSCIGWEVLFFWPAKGDGRTFCYIETGVPAFCAWARSGLGLEGRQVGWKAAGLF